MKNPNSLELLFEPLSEKHFENYCEMEMDPEVMKYYISRPHGTAEASRESFNKYLNYQEKFPHIGGYAVFTKSSKDFVGVGVLIHLGFDTNDTRFEVGYRLPRRAWGKGFATKICQALMEYAYSDLAMTEIYATTHPENIVSQKVLIKSGFSHIGKSDHHGGSEFFRATRV